MFLDRPGRFFYRHGVDLYSVMRIFCTDYRYWVCGAVILIAALLGRLILTDPEILSTLGVTMP